MAWIRRSPPDYSFSLSSFYGAGKVGQCYGCLMVNMVMVMVKMVIVHGCQGIQDGRGDYSDYVVGLDGQDGHGGQGVQVACFYQGLSFTQICRNQTTC